MKIKILFFLVLTLWLSGYASSSYPCGEKAGETGAGRPKNTPNETSGPETASNKDMVPNKESVSNKGIRSNKGEVGKDGQPEPGEWVLAAFITKFL
jgi:hypothetical protein